MNIFKILASGKFNFREEFISSFLAYLFSPKMDHGGGTTFLLELILALGEKQHGYIQLERTLQQMNETFRENIIDGSDQQFAVELEFPYKTSKDGQGFLDIVIKINDWFIVIENKILQGSRTKNQVKEQYRGIKRALMEQEGFESDHKILFLYLVPAQRNWDNWTVSESFVKEIQINHEPQDIINIISWQPVEEQEYVSLVEVFRRVLKKELYGEISPLGNDIKHSLKSIIDFAMGEFLGYSYERATTKKDVSKMKVKEILLLNEDVYIGVQYGLAGIANQAWKNAGFLERTLKTSKTRHGWQYVDLKTFKSLALWAMNPDQQSLSGIEWSGRPFAIETLYRVAKAAGSEIKIGLNGGITALRAAETADITGGKLGSRGCLKISRESNSPNWFGGDEFVEVLESKGISWK